MIGPPAVIQQRLGATSSIILHNMTFLYLIHLIYKMRKVDHAPSISAFLLQVSGEKDFFAKMVVDAVSALDPDTLDLSLLGVKKVQGGGLRDSFLVDGVAFKKTFSYAGFEMQRKKYANPKILALNIELELKSEKENAEVRQSCACFCQKRRFYKTPLNPQKADPWL